MFRPFLLSACLVLPALAAEGAQVMSGAFAEWRFEVVSHIAPGGAERVACSVATGPEASPTLFISFAQDSMQDEGEISGFAFFEVGAPLGEMPIGAATEIEFVAGDIRSRGKVSVAESPDGELAQSEAYPANAETPQLLQAMQTSSSISLMRGSEVLRTISLAGFIDAYAVAAKACNYAPMIKG